MSGDGGVELVDLGHRFGAVQVFEGVSAKVAAGDVACLIGPNGSGKTTLLRSIAGLLTPTSGAVSVDLDHAGGRRIGYLPQSPRFLEVLSARETLSFYGDLVAGETDVSARFGQVGLEDVADRRVGALSGGMVRLLGLAQAVIGEPPLLVLDEPASGLDPTMARHVETAIDDLAAAGDTVILATHDLAAVERIADDVLVLDRGEIVAQGPPASLLERTDAATLAGAFASLTAGERATVDTGRSNGVPP